MKDRLRVLVAHSDSRESSKIKDILEDWGYEVHVVHHVNEAMGKAQHTGEEIVPNVVLLCKDAVRADKVSLIKSLRKTMPAPIILMSMQRDETAIVEALDSGAHDYFFLPFGTNEHRARIGAAIRNTAMRSGKNVIFEVPGLKINFDSREVLVRGRLVKMTPIEFRILTLLAKSAGKVLTHGELINEVWGPYNSDNLVLRVNMANIRKKIEENPSSPKFIFTETGIGYRMVSE